MALVARCSLVLVTISWLATPVLAQPVAGGQQVMPRPHCTVQALYCPVNAQPWSYVAPPLTGTCMQTYRLFLPDGPAPADGWPVLINFDLAVFLFTSDHPELPTPDSTPGAVKIFDGLMIKALDAGIAVVAARSTPSPPITPGSIWDECGPGFTLPGHGMFHPPGYVPSDLTFAPYEDLDYHMAEKDAIMVIQHVRHLARGESPVGKQEVQMAKLDHRRIAVHGASAGAIAFMWPAFGPERRHDPPFAGLGGQYDESTRADVAIMGTSHIWLPVFSPTGASEHHWGFDGHSEIPAGTVNQTDIDELVANSAVFYEDCSLNANLPTYMYELEDSALDAYDKMTGAPCAGAVYPGLPLCYGVEGMSDTVHPKWNGYTWREAYDHTFLALAGTAVPDPNVDPPDGDFASVSALEDSVVSWLVDRFAEEPDEWNEITDVRLPGDVFCTSVPVPGVAGTPVLTATGTLLVDDPLTIALSDAEPGALAGLHLSTGAINFPSLGGVLVPDPALLFDLPTYTVAADGTAVHSGPYPASLGPGFGFYGQWVVAETGGGTAASNAFYAVAP